MTDLRRPAVLSAEHDRSQFSCGVDVFDVWLRRYAGQNRRNNHAATWVIADAVGRVAAYATLSMTSIDHGNLPAGLRKGAPDPVPALLIGRLAIDVAFAGQGVGTALVRYLLGTAVELNLAAACGAVVVSAYNDSAREWWLTFGFQPLDEGAGLDLYLTTKDIAKTLEL